MYLTYKGKKEVMVMKAKAKTAVKEKVKVAQREIDRFETGGAGIKVIKKPKPKK